MRLHVVLIVLLAVATATFVVGIGVERAHGENDAGETSRMAHEDGGERGEAAHAEQSAHADESSTETFLGIEYEAVPFVALAAAFSLALAVAVWLRPGSKWLLLVVAVAMLAFALLDAREVAHQLDDDNGGLALLAAAVAALHLAVGAVALALARRPAQSARALT